MVFLWIALGMGKGRISMYYSYMAECIGIYRRLKIRNAANKSCWFNYGSPSQFSSS